jgi:anti-sigma B factor antagonist/stage II sporulation protein AA (anti-sigma F factor antagonist)
MTFKMKLDELDPKKMIIQLHGRLDSDSSPKLEEKIKELCNKGYTRILLDFGRVEFLTSAGMRVLLSGTRSLRALKGNLILFSLQEDAEGVIRIAGLDKILMICPTEEDAKKVQ